MVFYEFMTRIQYVLHAQCSKKYLTKSLFSDSQGLYLQVNIFGLLGLHKRLFVEILGRRSRIQIGR